MREKKRFLHVGLRATRSLALFKSVKIRVLRFIRVLFRPNNSTTQFTLISHLFFLCVAASLREITFSIRNHQRPTSSILIID